jgi:hypothetical protein
MINSSIKIGFWCILFSLHYAASAQFVLPPITPESDDLARIKTAYSQAGVVSCKMTYQLFAPDATQAADSMMGSLTMLGSDYHFKIGQFEYLQQGNRFLYIDHEAQSMMLFHRAKSHTDPTNSGQIASLLDNGGVVAEVQNIGGKQRKLILEPAQSAVENVEIWYNTDSYFIEKTRTVLAQNKAVLEVKYGQIKQPKTGFSYSISSFTVLKNKKYAPTDKYKGYKIKVTG